MYVFVELSARARWLFDFSLQSNVRLNVISNNSKQISSQLNSIFVGAEVKPRQEHAGATLEIPSEPEEILGKSALGGKD